LALGDFHLFGSLKQHLGGKSFTDYKRWLRQQSKDFYAEGFDTLVKRWDKCIKVGARYVEK
jgi:hypothetical protein